jgi:hypothetical protein
MLNVRQEMTVDLDAMTAVATVVIILGAMTVDLAVTTVVAIAATIISDHDVTMIKNLF